MPLDDLIERGSKRAIHDLFLYLIVMALLYAITGAIGRKDLSNLVLMYALIVVTAYSISSTVKYTWSRRPYLEVLVYFVLLFLISYVTKIDDYSIYVFGILLLLLRAIKNNRLGYVAIILMTLMLLGYLIKTHP